MEMCHVMYLFSSVFHTLDPMCFSVEHTYCYLEPCLSIWRGCAHMCLLSEYNTIVIGKWISRIKKNEMQGV